MRYFFDIGHPAHVHYFKNVIFKLKGEGHEVFISARERFPVFELLEAYKLPYFNRGKGADSKIGKLLYLVKADLILLSKALKFKPDILLGFGSPYIAHVAKVIGKPSIVIDDTDNASLNHKLYGPFARHVLTPAMFQPDFGRKQLRFDGYMELAYLHHKYFKPDRSILDELGVKEGETFSILRFVAWTANHDFGHNGLTVENKIRAVKEFERFGKVFITSESGVPDEIKHHVVKFEPHRMHHAMSFASLLFGESATMASESAMLGVPAIYFDNEGRSYTTDLEREHRIVFNFTESVQDQEKGILKGIEILSQPDGKGFKNRALHIQESKVCFTDLIYMLLSNYPESCEETEIFKIK